MRRMFMKANYHTHTARCKHASGTEREYVEAAIANGLKILGFADHTPYPMPADHSHSIRMGMQELEDYVNTVLALRDEYRNDIEIHLGLEVEYFPTYFEKLREAISDYPIEYFLLAQHYLGNSAPGEMYCASPTEDPEKLTAYCDQVISAIDMGCFTYLAHPDLPCFTGDDVIYETQMRRICRRAKEASLPLEINFIGIGYGRHYPDERFWKIVGQESCDVILGLDAHQLIHFQFQDTHAKALEIVKKYDLHLLEDVKLKKPVS